MAISYGKISFIHVVIFWGHWTPLFLELLMLCDYHFLCWNLGNYIFRGKTIVFLWCKTRPTLFDEWQHFLGCITHPTLCLDVSMTRLLCRASRKRMHKSCCRGLLPPDDYILTHCAEGVTHLSICLEEGRSLSSSFWSDFTCDYLFDDASDWSYDR